MIIGLLLCFALGFIATCAMTGFDADEDPGYVLGFFIITLALTSLGVFLAITYGNGDAAQFRQKTEVGIVYRVVARTDDHLLIKNEQSGKTLFVEKSKEEVPDLFVVSEEKKLIAVHDNK